MDVSHCSMNYHRAIREAATRENSYNIQYTVVVFDIAGNESGVKPHVPGYDRMDRGAYNGVAFDLDEWIHWRNRRSR